MLRNFQSGDFNKSAEIDLSILNKKENKTDMLKDVNNILPVDSQNKLKIELVVSYDDYDEQGNRKTKTVIYDDNNKATDISVSGESGDYADLYLVPTTKTGAPGIYLTEPFNIFQLYWQYSFVAELPYGISLSGQQSLNYYKICHAPVIKPILSITFKFYNDEELVYTDSLSVNDETGAYYYIDKTVSDAFYNTILGNGYTSNNYMMPYTNYLRFIHKIPFNKYSSVIRGLVKSLPSYFVDLRRCTGLNEYVGTPSCMAGYFVYYRTNDTQQCGYVPISIKANRYNFADYMYLFPVYDPVKKLHTGLLIYNSNSSTDLATVFNTVGLNAAYVYRESAYNNLPAVSRPSPEGIAEGVNMYWMFKFSNGATIELSYTNDQKFLYIEGIEDIDFLPFMTLTSTLDLTSFSATFRPTFPIEAMSSYTGQRAYFDGYTNLRLVML